MKKAVPLFSSPGPETTNQPAPDTKSQPASETKSQPDNGTSLAFENSNCCFRTLRFSKSAWKHHFLIADLWNFKMLLYDLVRQAHYHVGASSVPKIDRITIDLKLNLSVKFARSPIFSSTARRKEIEMTLPTPTEIQDVSKPTQGIMIRKEADATSRVKLMRRGGLVREPTTNSTSSE